MSSGGWNRCSFVFRAAISAGSSLNRRHVGQQHPPRVTVAQIDLLQVLIEPPLREGMRLLRELVRQHLHLRHLYRAGRRSCARGGPNVKSAAHAPPGVVMPRPLAGVAALLVLLASARRPSQPRASASDAARERERESAERFRGLLATLPDLGADVREIVASPRVPCGRISAVAADGRGDLYVLHRRRRGARSWGSTPAGACSGGVQGVAGSNPAVPIAYEVAVLVSMRRVLLQLLRIAPRRSAWE